MRVFLFALMIALLPLRGFAGDVMATEMAIQMAAQTSAEHSQPESGLSHHADATEIAAANAHHSRASSHLHSHQDTAPAKEAVTTASACTGHAATEQCHSSDNHGSCQACQACHTVALSLAFNQAQPVLVSSSLPHLAAAQFASAEVALGQKPPIF